uniref:hypothetical protein n=1 Tax=Flavobacterium sp. TaxID=239 RepID=UPI0037C0E5C3
MQMNKVMESYYQAMLAYAGITVKDNILTNVNEKLGPLKVDDKHLMLPYFENLKNPGDCHIFHPLNENFASPENTHFNLYKKKLIFELNMRLSTLVISMISLGANPVAQQRLKSSEAISLMSNLGEVELSTIEYFVSLVKASQKLNDAGYLFDIYLKKNGSIGDISYLAIGKINFVIYRELQKALEDHEKTYKVLDVRMRKKDIVTLLSVFEAIFPNIGKPDDFIVGSDNKVFRYMSALMLASYPVAYRLNEIADLLEEAKDPSLELNEVRSDLSWAKQIESVYQITDEIRNIPNQTCLKSEAHQLKVDESKVKEPTRSTPPVYSIPQFSQQSAQAPAQPPQHQQSQYQQQPMPQPPAQPPQPLSVEDIVRGAGMMQNGTMPGMMPGIVPGMMTGFLPANGYPQMYPQPMMPQQGMMQYPPYQQPVQMPQQPQPVAAGQG